MIKKIKPQQTKNYNFLWKNIGPGFLLAGAAIGVSHLVQATRAGADYGFALIWVLVIACVSKYPFLEFGPRYTAATGNDLITGYKKLGNFSYWTYIILTVGTMFVIQASVTIVTAGLAEQLFQMGWSPFVWSCLILLFCIVLLFLGKYSGLDLSMKVVVTFLTLATFISVLLALGAGTLEKTLQTSSPSYWNTTGIAFLIAFMGWMPIPLDAAVWHSLWTKEKAANGKIKLSVRGSFIDFNVGYLSAAIIGLFFLSLGALVMFGNGDSFSSNSIEFSTQLINLYRIVLGNWSYLLVSVAAFVTMLSTTLTVADVYPRVISEIAMPRDGKIKTKTSQKQNIYRVSLILVPILSLSILYFTAKSFTFLVDFAAGLSFLSAPFLAWFNYKLVTHKDVPAKDRPNKAYRIFSWICLCLLIAFSLVYVWFNFFK